MEISDKELYKAYLKGDEEAFELLVKRHKNNIIYFISTYTKNIQIAEDISQDVFVYILLNKKQYDFRYSFKTYLYMIAKCRALNYIKKENKILNIEEYENIKNIIKKLKPDYQEIIYLTTYEGFKYREVAKIMNKNMGQVKALLNRAKKKLKELLEKEGISNDE